MRAFAARGAAARALTRIDLSGGNDFKSGNSAANDHIIDPQLPYLFICSNMPPEKP